MAWDITKPAGSTSLRDSDDQIRANWVALEAGSPVCTSWQIDVNAADAPLYFKNNTTTKWTVGNDATADNFAIASGSALGTNDVMTVQSTGEITFPLQPCVIATFASNQNNVTGDNTAYTVTWATEIVDQNADFASNTFTASTTGYYLMNVNLFVTEPTAHTQAILKIITSNRTYVIDQFNPTYAAASGGYCIKGSIIADMDANDTATVTITVGNATKDVDLTGTSAGASPHWSIFKLC